MHALALLLLQSRPDPEQAARIMAMVMPIIGIITIIALVIFIVPFWFICKKAGFSPWLSLLNLVPLGSLILLYILAFAEWRTLPPPPFPYPYPPAPPQG
ncbi:MAG: hypothetical protein P4L40_10160 [Terracidiphilus sp.]|nr:hypothetical protein [Terracidiphilus sp.]